MMLHDRCDLIVATAATGGGQRGVREVAVLFLNSELVLRWAEVMLETFCAGHLTCKNRHPVLGTCKRAPRQ
jgi:hypothetical protein